MSCLANCGLFDDALDAKQGLGFRMKEIWEWVLEMGEIEEMGQLGIGVECRGSEKEAINDSSVITASSTPAAPSNHPPNRGPTPARCSCPLFLNHILDNSQTPSLPSRERNNHHKEERDSKTQRLRVSET
ncbi:hypothetical protein ACFX2A_025960 [Malus domestica]